jgi:hypothetical protein
MILMIGRGRAGLGLGNRLFVITVLARESRQPRMVWYRLMGNDNEDSGIGLYRIVI